MSFLDNVKDFYESPGDSLGKDFIHPALKECVLYVTLEPCQMCAGASYWTQLDKIVYVITILHLPDIFEKFYILPLYCHN